MGLGGAELTASGVGYWTIAALIAATPRRGRTEAPGAETYTRWSPSPPVLGLLLVIGQHRPAERLVMGWALWLVLLLTLLQAGVAVVALCSWKRRDPAPRPRPRYRRLRPYGPPRRLMPWSAGAPVLGSPQATGYPRHGSRRRLPAGGSPTTAGGPSDRLPPARGAAAAGSSGRPPTTPPAAGGALAPARPEPSGLYLSCDRNRAGSRRQPGASAPMIWCGLRSARRWWRWSSSRRSPSSSWSSPTAT